MARARKKKLEEEEVSRNEFCVIRCWGNILLGGYPFIHSSRRVFTFSFSFFKAFTVGLFVFVCKL